MTMPGTVASNTPSSWARFIGWRSSPTTTATSLAPRRSVRMTVVPPDGCAPRTECGSCTRPAISSSIYAPPRRRVGDSATLAQQPVDRLQRYAQPARPVPGLVGGLVHRFVQLVRTQHLPMFARIEPCHLGVAVAERALV